MFVSVSYYDEATQAFKTGRTYTYKTVLPLAVGDVVAAPVKNRGTGALEDKRAMVVSIYDPEPSFACNQIVSMWMGDKDDGRAE